MTRYHGGTAVSNGYYWNQAAWSLSPVAHDGEKLPGGAQAEYRRIPLWVVFAVAPVMGGLFVVFLPLIGFVLTFQAGVRLLLALLHRTATEIGGAMTMGWQPGEAHLTGKRSETTKEEKGPPAEVEGDEPLEALEKEIAEKRER